MLHCVCIYVYIRVCLCVCVCVCANSDISIRNGRSVLFISDSFVNPINLQPRQRLIRRYYIQKSKVF